MDFSDILGHERQVGFLLKILNSDRVGGAYLFCSRGADGIGKKQVALAFARALNCEDFKGTDACGICSSCTAALAGAHPNILVVEPDEKGVLKIDQVRTLQKALRYRVESGRRVCVVDGADKMLRAASNVLLKTLEEPPRGSMVILLSSNPDSLLPTILSRCQRINFYPLANELVAGLIADKFGLGSGEALTIARLSGGSPARAAEMVEEGSLEHWDVFFTKFAGINGCDVTGVLDFAGELAKDERIVQTLEFLKIRYRDLVTRGAGHTDPAAAGDMDTRFFIPGGNDMDGALRSFELVEQARRDIMPPRYANKTLAMESLFINLFGLC